MPVGRLWKGERAEFRDPVTGRRLVRLSHHEQPDCACYYTNNGWLADGRRLVFTSLRTGAMNFFLADVERDEILQLTDHPSLNVRRGSYYVDANDFLYYWRTPELVRLDLNTLGCDVLWAHPPDAFVSIPAVNRTGDRMIVTCLRHEQLDLAEILRRRVMAPVAGKTPRRIMLESRAQVFGLELPSGKARALPLPPARACGCGYAVWSPVDPDRFWMGVGRAANPGPEILVVDWRGGDEVSFHSVGPRTDAELFDHVFWSADGRRILFKYREKAYGEPADLLRRVEKPLYELGWVEADVERGPVHTAPLPFRNTHINHVPGRDWLVGDGGFEKPEEQHVYRIDVRPQGCLFISLAWHGNRFDRSWPYFSEGLHEPNVRANRQGTAVSFTCSREGISPDVYVLDLAG